MHFAEIDKITNEVIRVVRCESDNWCELNLGGTWVRTYYSTPGKNYAGVGYIYYPELLNFATPSPFPSWKLDASLVWQPPVSCPSDQTMYTWNENTLSWVPFSL